MTVTLKTIMEREGRSEYEANTHLATQSSGEGTHHIYVKTKGKMKAIAGPFKTKEEAEASPQRKWGDGVAPSHMVESFELEEKMKQVQEAKAGDNYHSVFLKTDNKWIHHADLDNKDDANEEMRSMRNNGEKPVRLVVPKGEANWHKMGADGIHDYVEGRVKKAVKESFVEHVYGKDFTQAEAAFKSMIGEKVAIAMAARKVEIAQSLYARATKESE